MTRFRALLVAPALLLLAAAPAWAGPALVTASQGVVTLDGAAAPAAPFLVPDGGRLELGADGVVVVLQGGRAQRHSGAGPVRLDQPDDGAAAASGALQGLLQHKVDTSRAGATRAGGAVTLVRPVPRSPLLQLSTVRWRCDQTCPDAAVELVPLGGGAALWTGSGAGSVDPGPLDLAAGAYELRIGADRFPLLVPDADRAAELTALLTAADAAAAALPADDRAGRASVAAAVRWQAGLFGDALAVLDDALAQGDDPLLASLLADYERALGLVP